MTQRNTGSADALRNALHALQRGGFPTILLDRYDNSWRWLSGRGDSPWYSSTLRIIRQTTPGDWPGVLRRAAALLHA